MSHNFQKQDKNSNDITFSKKLNSSHSHSVLRPIVQFKNQHEQHIYQNLKNYENQDKKLAYSHSSSSFQNQNSQNHTNKFLNEKTQTFQKTNNLNKIIQEESIAKLQSNRKLQYLQSEKPSTNKVMDSNQKKHYQYYFKKDGSSSHNSANSSAQKTESQRYMRYQKYQQSKKKGRQSSNPSLQNINAQKSRVSLPIQFQKRSSLYSSNFDSTSILQKKSYPKQDNSKDMSKSSHVKFITPSQFNNGFVSQNNNLKQVRTVEEVQQFKLGDFAQKTKFQQSQVSIESQNNAYKALQYQNLRQPRQMTIANPIINSVNESIEPLLQKHTISQKNVETKKFQSQAQLKNRTQSISVTSSQQNWEQKLNNFKSIQQLKRDFELLLVNYKKQKQQKQLLQNKRKNHLDQILRQQNYIKDLQSIQEKYTSTTKEHQAQINNFTFIIQKLQNQNKNIKADYEELMNTFQEKLSNSMIKQTSSSQQKIKQYEQKLENYLKQLHKLNVKLDQTKTQNLQNETKLKGQFEQQFHDFKEYHNKQIKKLQVKQNQDLSNLAKYYQEREKKIIVQWERKFSEEQKHHENIVIQLRQSNFAQIDRLNTLRNTSQAKSQQREQLIIKAKNQEIKRKEQLKNKQVLKLNAKISQLSQKLTSINQIHEKEISTIRFQLQKQEKLNNQISTKVKSLEASSTVQTQQIKTYKLYSQNLKKEIAKNKEDEKILIENGQAFQAKVKELEIQNQKNKKSFNQLEEVCNSIRQQLLQSKNQLKKSQEKYNNLKQDSPKRQSKLQQTLIQKEIVWKQSQQNWKIKQQSLISQIQQSKQNIIQLQVLIRQQKLHQDTLTQELQKLKESLKQQKAKAIYEGSQIIDLKNRQSALIKENDQLWQKIKSLNQQIKTFKENIILIQSQRQSKQKTFVQEKANRQSTSKDSKEKDERIINLQNALQVLNIVIQGKNHQFAIISQKLDVKKNLFQDQTQKILKLEQKNKSLQTSSKQLQQKLITTQKQLNIYKVKSKQNVIDQQEEDQNQQKKTKIVHQSIQTESNEKNLLSKQTQKSQECLELYQQLQYKQSVIKQLQSQLQDSIQITKSLKLKLQQYQNTPGQQTDRSIEQFTKPIEIISLKDIKLKQFYSKVQEYYNEVLEVFGLDHMDFNQVQQIINVQTQQNSENSLTKMQEETTEVKQQNPSQKSMTFSQKVNQMSQNQQQLLRLINQWIKKLQKQALTITQHQQRSQFMQQKINVLNNQNQELSLEKIEIYQKYEGFITKLEMQNQEYQQKLNEISHKLFECQTFCGQLQAILHDTNAQLLKYTIFGINIAKNNQLALDDILDENRPYLLQFQQQHQKYMIQKKKSEILQTQNKKEQYEEKQKLLQQSLKDKRPRAQSLTDSLHIQDEQKMDEQTLQKQLSEKNILLNSDSSQEEELSNQQQQQQNNQKDKNQQVSKFQETDLLPPKNIAQFKQSSRAQLQKKGEQMANNSLQQLLKKIQAIQKKISSSKKIIPRQQESPRKKQQSSEKKQIKKQTQKGNVKQKNKQENEFDIQFYAQLNEEKQQQTQKIPDLS